MAKDLDSELSLWETDILYRCRLKILAWVMKAGTSQINAKKNVGIVTLSATYSCHQRKILMEYERHDGSSRKVYF